MCRASTDPKGGYRCPNHLLEATCKHAIEHVRDMQKATSDDQIRTISYRAIAAINKDNSLGRDEREAAVKLVMAQREVAMAAFGKTDAVKQATAARLEVARVGLIKAQRARGRKNSTKALNQVTASMRDTFHGLLPGVTDDLRTLSKASDQHDHASIDAAVTSISNRIDKYVADPYLNEVLHTYLTNQRNRLMWPNMLPDWPAINGAAADIERIKQYGE